MGAEVWFTIRRINRRGSMVFHRTISARMVTDLATFTVTSDARCLAIVDLVSREGTEGTSEAKPATGIVVMRSTVGRGPIVTTGVGNSLGGRSVVFSVLGLRMQSLSLVFAFGTGTPIRPTST